MAEDKNNIATPAEDKGQDKPVVDVDTAALLAEKDARIAKLSEERENYRLGMLKAKGKLPSDGTATTPEDLDALVEAKVKEHIASTELFKAQQEKDDLIKRH